jgi:hypothetical protein
MLPETGDGLGAPSINSRRRTTTKSTRGIFLAMSTEKKALNSNKKLFPDMMNSKLSLGETLKKDGREYSIIFIQLENLVDL